MRSVQVARKLGTRLRSQRPEYPQGRDPAIPHPWGRQQPISSPQPLYDTWPTSIALDPPCLRTTIFRSRSNQSQSSLARGNYVTWKQRLTLALLLTRSNSFIDPNTKVPADSSLDTWTDRDNQVVAAILSTTSESIFSAHIDHLNDSTIWSTTSLLPEVTPSGGAPLRPACCFIW
jgi:hypothetical protein